MEGFFGKREFSTTKSNKTTDTLPWVEKYRPNSIDDIVAQEEVVSVLKKCLDGRDFPNLMFYGPPGTGKTSTIIAVCKHLFGNEFYKERVLELNASDERGINVVREKIKNFAQLAASSSLANGRPCPPFRIVILDEADAMTHAAQAALRRTMERETKTTRFCLICNYISRIIEPLISRCSKFRFKELPVEQSKNRIYHICQEENVLLDEDALELLLNTTEGDLRRAINFLHSASRMCPDKHVTAVQLKQILGIVPDEIVQDLLKCCKSGSYEKLKTAIEDFLADGYCASQLILQLMPAILNSMELNEYKKSLALLKLGEVDLGLIDGADEYLQLLKIFSKLLKLFFDSD